MVFIYSNNSDNGIRNRYTRIFMGNIANVIQIDNYVDVDTLNLLSKKKNVFAYHIGASIKDAGKKCFGINLIQDAGIVKDKLERLKIETEES